MQVVDNLGLGGAQTVVVALARAAQSDPAIDVEVLSLAEPRPSPALEQLTAMSVPVHHLGPVRSRELLDARALRLRRILRDGRFDIVHAHLDYSMVLSAIATRRSGVGCVLTLHNTVSELCELGSPRRNLAQWAARSADLVLACGSRVRRESPLAAVRSDVVVSTNPAPDVGTPSTADRAAARRLLADEGADLVVITVSRLAPSKNIDRVIDAVGALRVRGLAVELAVIGEGPERIGLERRVRPGDGVRFLGQRSDATALMAGADVLVCPFGRNEGMPMSVLEAMAAGVAVVGSASGDMAAVLGDGRGLIIEPPTVASIESALGRLAEDPDRRATMTATALGWVESERSLAAWVDRTVEHYAAVISSRRADRSR